MLRVHPYTQGLSGYNGFPVCAPWSVSYGLRKLMYYSETSNSIWGRSFFPCGIQDSFIYCFMSKARDVHSQGSPASWFLLTAAQPRLFSESTLANMLDLLMKLADTFTRLHLDITGLNWHFLGFVPFGFDPELRGQGCSRCFWRLDMLKWAMQSGPDNRNSASESA